jgi:hypothetical protein
MQFRAPTRGPRHPKRHEGGVVGGCLAGARRRHRGEAAENEKGDATPDLLLKHPDATHATYV